MKKIIISLLFSILVLSSAWAQAAKVVTGVEQESRNIQSKQNIEIANYTVEDSAEIEVISENSITLKDTLIEEGSIFSAQVETVSTNNDSAVNVENIAPPQSVNFNTSPAGRESLNPLAGYVELEAPSANLFGTVDISYPIWAPEGIAGMTPGVGIYYSSDRKMDNCGIGWGYDTSSIMHNSEKGKPSYVLEEMMSGNTFAKNLMLDGMELVSAGSGEYRFKHESSFAKIKENGSGYIVYLTDGSKLYYGESGNARTSDPADGSRIYEWHISSEVDKDGNKMTYHYTTYGNQKYISSIRYGYLTDTDYMYRVDFVWENRLDVRTNYWPGFLITRDRRLKTIKIVRKAYAHNTTNYNEAVLKRYEFAYTLDGFGKSLLTGIKEYENGISTSALNSHTFQYQDPMVTGKFENEVAWDFGSFGITGTPYKFIGCSNRSFFDVDQDDDVAAYTEDDINRMIDLNNDGLVDVMRILKNEKGYHYKIIVELNNGSGFHPNEIWMEKNDFNYSVNSDVEYFLEGIADMNNDGRPDLMFRQNNKVGTRIYFNKMVYYENTGSSFIDRGEDWLGIKTKMGSYYDSFVQNKGIEGLVDLDGDKLIDLYSTKIISGTMGMRDQIFYGNGKTYFSAPSLTWQKRDQFYIADTSFDINGDRLPDMLKGTRSGGSYYSFFTGSVYETASRYSCSTDSNNVYADLNNDGIPESIKKNIEGDKVLLDLSLNRGIQFDSAISNWFVRDFNTNELGDIFIFDINGDGAADIIRQKSYNEWFVSLNKMAYSNVLTGVLNDYTGVAQTYSYEEVHHEDILFNQRRNHVLEAVAVQNTIFDVTDNAILSAVTSFEYSHGVYDPFKKEFRGFEKVTVVSRDKSITDRVVNHVSETTYKVDDLNGSFYDEYYYGQVDTERSYIDDGGTIINQGKTKYFYEKYTPLSSCPEIKFVNTKEIRSWMYNEDGTFIDPANSSALTNGYLSETNTITFSSHGLPDLDTTTQYGDPMHSKDDVIRVIDYNQHVTSLDWLCLPFQKQTKDINHYQLTLETFYYDKLGACQMTKGKVSKSVIWNNNSDADAVTTYEYGDYGLVTETNSGSEDIMYTETKQRVSVTFRPADYPDYARKVVTTSLGNKTSVAVYDWYGNAVVAIDPYGDRTQNFYDPYGRLVQSKSYWKDETGAEQSCVTFGAAYSGFLSNGLFKATAQYIEDIDGAVNDDRYLSAEYYADCLGRIVQVKAEGVVYNTATGVNDHVWGITGKITYDAMGRAVETGAIDIRSFSGNDGYIPIAMLEPKTQVFYDDKGRISSKTDQSGLVLNYEYGTVIDYDFNNGDGRILSELTVTDNQDHEVIIYKDAAGQSVRTKVLKDDLGNYAETNYIYELSGTSKTVTPEGKEIITIKDSLGRTKETITPDAGVTRYTYKYKKLISTIVEEGTDSANAIRREKTFTYDNYDRITSIDVGNPDEKVTYSYYPGAGLMKYNRWRLHKESIANTCSTFSYEKFSVEKAKMMYGKNFVTTMTSDISGRISEIDYPGDGLTVEYLYNKGGFLDSVKKIGGGDYISTIGYDKFGQRVFVEYGNGVESSYEYDTANLLLDKYTIKNAGGTNILAYDYDFDLNGNIVKIANTSIKGSIQDYVYDRMGRLTSSTGSFAYGTVTDTYTRSYKYNDDSRLIKKVFSLPGGGSDEYNYWYGGANNAANAVDYITDKQGRTIIDLGYDDFGNMNSKIYTDDANKNQNHSHSNTNRIKSITGARYSLDFLYDGSGQRYLKDYLVDGVKERSFLYVNGLYTANDIGSNGSLDVVNRHIWDGSRLIATEINNDASKTQYYHANHIGSTAMLTDNTGKEVRQYLYYPYGETWMTLDNIDNPTDGDTNKLFTGQEKDKESNLYYYNARYYDADICVFTRPDPAMDGVNHYGYVVGNPVMYDDPTGMKAANYTQKGLAKKNAMKRGSHGGGPIVATPSYTSAMSSRGRSAAASEGVSDAAKKRGFQRKLSGSIMLGAHSISAGLFGGGTTSFSYNHSSSFSFSASNCTPSGGGVVSFGVGGGFNLMSNMEQSAPVIRGLYLNFSFSYDPGSGLSFSNESLTRGFYKEKRSELRGQIINESHALVAMYDRAYNVYDSMAQIGFGVAFVASAIGTLGTNAVPAGVLIGADGLAGIISGATGASFDFNNPHFDSSVNGAVEILFGPGAPTGVMTNGPFGTLGDGFEAAGDGLNNAQNAIGGFFRKTWNWITGN